MNNEHQGRYQGLDVYVHVRSSFAAHNILHQYLSVEKSKSKIDTMNSQNISRNRICASPLMNNRVYIETNTICAKLVHLLTSAYKSCF